MLSFGIWWGAWKQPPLKPRDDWSEVLGAESSLRTLGCAEGLAPPACPSRWSGSAVLGNPGPAFALLALGA